MNQIPFSTVSTLNKVGRTRRVRKPFGHISDMHWVFEHRTELTGRLRLTLQTFSKLNSGQTRIFRSRYRYGTQNRRIGAGRVKINIPGSMVTRQFYKCTKEAERTSLVDSAGTVPFLLSVWSEYREIRISGSRYLRGQLLCCCQHESKTSTQGNCFRFCILFRAGKIK